MLACPRCRTTYPDDVKECPEDGSPLLPSHILPADDGPLEPGTMVGEYRVDHLLGSGTFGDVYAGEQPLIGKRVAIKLLRRKLSSDAEVVSRFVAEARAVNRIRHRNIIDIFSFGLLDDHRHYFVMELLDGLTLGELLEKEHRLSLGMALPIFRNIASGLDAAHEAGITHRDLKPDNVFLARERDGSYFAKLLDFGVAKLLGEDVAHKTATGMAIGTPRYMSPEQCRGKAVDHRADIYSLGVLVHEALTGRWLFEGDTAMEVLFAHMNDPPPPMSELCPDLPRELDAPVLAMLAKKPKDRPASAGAAIEALADLVREGHISVTFSAGSGPATSPVSAARSSVIGDRASMSQEDLNAATVAVPAPDAPPETDDDGSTATVAAVSANDSGGVTTEPTGAPAQSKGTAASTAVAQKSAASGTLLSEGPLPPSGKAETPSSTLPSVGQADTDKALPSGSEKARRSSSNVGILALAVLAAAALVAAAIYFSGGQPVAEPPSDVAAALEPEESADPPAVTPSPTAKTDLAADPPPEPTQTVSQSATTQPAATAKTAKPTTVKTATAPAKAAPTDDLPPSLAKPDDLP